MTERASVTRKNSKRGPRPSSTACRDHILQAATKEFGDSGFQGATIRKIAELAEVDPKLVHYYFGSKQELFGAVIVETYRSRGLVETLADSSFSADESPGTRYVYAVLKTLEESSGGSGYLGLVRNLGTHEESRRMFLRFITEEMAGMVAPALSGPLPQTRVNLAGTHVLGVIMARYIVGIPSLMALSIEDLARVVGPTLDRYLFDDLPFSVSDEPKCPVPAADSSS